MLQCRDSRLIDHFPQFFPSVRFCRGGSVDFLADAQPFQIIAAIAVHRGIAAGSIVQPFFTAANRTISEVFRQVAIAAFLAFKQAIFKALFNRVKGLVA